MFVESIYQKCLWTRSFIKSFIPVEFSHVPQLPSFLPAPNICDNDSKRLNKMTNV